MQKLKQLQNCSIIHLTAMRDCGMSSTIHLLVDSRKVKVASSDALLSKLHTKRGDIMNTENTQIEHGQQNYKTILEEIVEMMECDLQHLKTDEARNYVKNVINDIKESL
jgi:hypothetical protein